MLLVRSLTYVLSAFSIGTGENLDKPQENGITWVTRNWQVTRDQPFTIEWDGHDGPVSVTLVRRAEDKWQSLWKVASDNTESSLVFRVPEHLSEILGDSEYAFQINDTSGKSAISPRWTVEARQAQGSGIIAQPDPAETSTSESSQPTESSSDDATQTSDGGSPQRTASDPNNQDSNSNSGNQGSDSNSSSGNDSSSNNSSNSSSSKGLRAGAKAGIGIGAAVGVGLVAGLIWLFMKKNREIKALKAAAAAPTPGDNAGLEVAKEQGQYQTHDSTYPGGQGPAELPSQHNQFPPPISELHHEPRPAELAYSGPTVPELPAKREG
ncbi:hypothetical protein N0V84_009431 [Fusarium piperis]|uniref:Ser-Thr-rich glycosyl-phosphatidyl-inositol-anchored membrane family-domain-containing protein n=1 Tax=Fusarium piperis TaxID=1435070 RepID=A0A9W8W6B9_9HYPO|nr:hypothetical protein N0V84_009431 [Fusarium piperis]